jgi:hypothetical protein
MRESPTTKENPNLNVSEIPTKQLTNGPGLSCFDCTPKVSAQQKTMEHLKTIV